LSGERQALVDSRGLRARFDQSSPIAEECSKTPARPNWKDYLSFPSLGRHPAETLLPIAGKKGEETVVKSVAKPTRGRKSRIEA